MLKPLLAMDRVRDAVKRLHVNEELQTVAFGEAFRQPFAMLPGTARDVVGNADIERTVAAIVMM